MNLANALSCIAIIVTVISTGLTVFIGVIQIQQKKDSSVNLTQNNFFGNVIIYNPDDAIIANNKIRTGIIVFLIFQSCASMYFMSGMGERLGRCINGMICTGISFAPALYGFIHGSITHDKNLRFLGLISGFIAIIPFFSTVFIEWVVPLIGLILIGLGLQSGVIPPNFLTPVP